MVRLNEQIQDAAKIAIRRYLNASEHSPTIQQFVADLGVSKEQIEEGYLRYALQSYDADNSIYESQTTHIAMWIEYQTLGGIHARRQEAVLNGLKRLRPNTIADIGFGAPTRYLYDYVLLTPSVTADLYDKFPAAIQVGCSIIKCWHESHLQRISFELHNMDANKPVGAHDCYLMLDSIEHAAEPERYLRETVLSAPQNAYFLFHLPIGPLINSHFIAWESTRNAVQWLNSVGLRVGHTEKIPSDSEVDFFSHQDVKIENLFVIAYKR